MIYNKTLYKIRKDKIKELKDGRTIRAFAEKTGLSDTHIGNVLNRSAYCPKYLATLLSLFGVHMQVSENRIQEIVDYFFEEVEK